MHVCMLAGMHICMYMSTYASKYACMHVRTCVYAQQQTHSWRIMYNRDCSCCKFLALSDCQLNSRNFNFLIRFEVFLVWLHKDPHKSGIRHITGSLYKEPDSIEYVKDKQEVLDKGGSDEFASYHSHLRQTFKFREKFLYIFLIGIKQFPLPVEHNKV